MAEQNTNPAAEAPAREMNEILRLRRQRLADLQAEGLLLGDDATVPEGLGFGSVLDDIAQLVDLDLGIGMPGTGGRRAIQAEIFDQLQRVLTQCGHTTSGSSV